MATEVLCSSGILVEDRLDSPETVMDDIRGQIESRIRYVLDGDGSAQDPLTAAMHAAVLSPGKRMRPLLLMLVARDLGCHSPALLDAACTVELVHAASLILDDMPCMDNAKFRRGRPALHIQFGENVAILAAVGLLSRAFHILANAADIFPIARTRLIGALAETIGTQGLVRGQFQDLHGGKQRLPEDIATTNQLKTGVLLGLSVEMAAIIAQVDERVFQSLRAFAIAAGHAFQIRDDMQDTLGNSISVTGKDVGLDVGKATLGATLGMENAYGRLADYLRDADRHLTAAIGSKQSTTRCLVIDLFCKGGPISNVHVH
jgi:geranylgeranyl diphosphate synthase type II